MSVSTSEIEGNNFDDAALANSAQIADAKAVDEATTHATSGGQQNAIKSKTEDENVIFQTEEKDPSVVSTTEVHRDRTELPIPTRSPLADEIEREASEHLARRAAEMGGSSHSPASRSISKGELPSPPPAPPVPVKDKSALTQRSVEVEYDEKHIPLNEESANDVLEAPKGVKEVAGLEIQTIMDQFQDSSEAIGEQEIMSPRLEKQQAVLVLPPRTSSLENADRRILSPQSTGGSIKSLALSPEGSRKPPSLSGVSLGKGKSDDTESLSSVRAGSIYQPPPPAPDPDPALPFDFHRFLEQLRHRTADPVARFLRSFLSEFGKKSWMAHEQVKIIADFLEFITKKMSLCEIWWTVSDAEFDNAKEGMEKLVMNRLYTQTFSPAIPPVASPRKITKNGRHAAEVANPQGPGRRGQHQEDVERDDVIAQKMRIYCWVREEHLDIKPINEKGRKFLALAQKELLKINSYRAPRDKVICVLNCCKVIFGYLKNSKSDQSADAFVPLFIYTVLRAQPQHLVSNVQYIWRFRNQEKLGGEAGYYMSSLLGVVTFIENLDRTNLTISDAEFEKEVEQAVSAIAEQNKADEYEGKVHVTAPTTAMHRLTEKSSLSRPEVTPRNSMDAEQVSPRRNVNQRLSEKTQTSSGGSNFDSDDGDAVSGLLRSIQKPLSSIGRMLSDELPGALRPAVAALPGSSPRALSPARSTGRQPSPNPLTAPRTPPAQATQATDAAARRASVETAQAQRVRAHEHAVVVETLQSMFPNLDKEVIEDVVRAQEGNVGRAVDACLAMSSGGT